ncbi:hypothetical protein OS188_05370 [Xanthomarina sp. F1114]|uniref:hypothetical protein n=1 Tax=Xanthomarina sp. F1114 TaxID=2996019 RepID=UPI00225DEC2E|nr:hypothetical protein [Xanthomarina sp. F1114]MCX7547381.1 hypothetical protein [Xanthomarina sp. F1114]
MLEFALFPKVLFVSLLEQTSIVTALFITVVFFLILLILGWRKSYLLKKESDKLNKTFSLDSDENKKSYRDFTEGHLYDNN